MKKTLNMNNIKLKKCKICNNLYELSKNTFMQNTKNLQ